MNIEPNNIYCGDCIDLMKDIEDNSIDSIVTDPPYGIRFMNKKWDYNVPKAEVWKECLRVLKPGGHILCACGTRTQHRMTVNIEDAGFEIRDIIAWVYGSGFPKSLDIGKAIDEEAGVDREIVGEKQHAKKNFKDNLYAQDPANANNERIFGYGKELLTAPATLEAKQWDGWGTALKPAMELWTLARKPLSEKTIAKNVLKHGTGGINIDGCRIEMTNNDFDEYEEKRKSFNGIKGKKYSGFMTSPLNNQIETKGRYPANIIHDGSDEVVSLFPETSSGDLLPHHNSGGESQIGTFNIRDRTGEIHPTYGDSGSAARFFYCAKASKEERNAGLEMTEGIRHADRLKNNGVGGENPRNRTNKPRKNHHPTIKPITLMRYLCRLITPPNGIILDLFVGSGSTCIGAKLEGFQYIGFDNNPEYIEIAEKRLETFLYQTRLKL